MTGSSVTVRARRGLAGVLAALVVLTGCAAIPTSGPVTEVEADSGLGQSTVRYSPALPTDGAAPADIIRGFLDAMLAYPSSTRTAAAFLTPSAAEAWQRQQGVTIYTDPQVATPPENGRTRADSGDTTQVVLDAATTGGLDQQGRYVAGDGRQRVEYRLAQVDGQWRITNPQPGLLVTNKFFTDYFRPFELYFFDRTAERLIPQPVHLLVGDGLAASLIASLAGGDESEQVQTFVPGLDDLRATVPVDGGVADVGFTAGSRRAEDVERLSAQVIWTLRQVPGLSGVRISVGSSPVRPRSVTDQPISSWGEFGVERSPEGQTHALAGNRVVTVDGSTVEAIAPPWGEDAAGAADVAVAGDRIALVSADRASVRVGALSGAIQRTVTGTDLGDPVADVDGQFWLLDRPGGATRVRIVGIGVSTVPAPGLAALDVRSIDISPEAARYVVTVGAGSDASVQVGDIIRDAAGVPVALSAPRRIAIGETGPRSAVWTDGIRVSFIADVSGGRQVQTALIDGSGTPAVSEVAGARLPDSDITGLAVGAGPDRPTHATDEQGALWFLTQRSTWTRVAEDPVRSLSFDR